MKWLDQEAQLWDMGHITSLQIVDVSSAGHSVARNHLPCVFMWLGWCDKTVSSIYTHTHIIFVWHPDSVKWVRHKIIIIFSWIKHKKLSMSYNYIKLTKQKSRNRNFFLMNLTYILSLWDDVTRWVVRSSSDHHFLFVTMKVINKGTIIKSRINIFLKKKLKLWQCYIGITSRP